jgi:hypothetical protein
MKMNVNGLDQNNLVINYHIDLHIKTIEQVSEDSKSLQNLIPKKVQE